MPIGPGRYRERIVGKNPFRVSPGSVLGKLLFYNNGNLFNTQNLKCTGINVSHRIQRCWDATNVPERGARGKRTYRSGGNFAMLDMDVFGNELRGPGVYSNLGSGVSWNNRTEYSGYFGIPDLTFDPNFSDYASGGGNIRSINPLLPPITVAMESAAWNARPKLEKVSGAAAIYELHELPDLLRGAAREFSNLWSDWGRIRNEAEFLLGLREFNPGGGIVMRPKRVGDDYLAFQFGWKPFVGDVIKMLDAVLFAEQYLSDLTRANNTWIKRSKTLEESSVTDRIASSLNPGIQPQGEPIRQLCRLQTSGGTTYYGTFELWRTTTLHTWAEGSFKFYRPEFDMNNEEFFSLINRVRRQLVLYGLRINPTHLWQIVPWSWLVDWFTNFGDLISRLDDQYNDGMVAKYLYVMHRKEISLDSFHTVNFWSGPAKFYFRRQITSKQRRTADSPYGFVLGGSLSASQWSILGALGLARNVRFARSF